MAAGIAELAGDAINAGATGDKARQQEITKIMGAMIGFVFSGGKGENVGIAGNVAASAHLNNYLSHLEAEELEDMELLCEQNDESACDRAGELLALDAQRDKELTGELKSACEESEEACLKFGEKVRELAEEHDWSLNGIEGVDELDMNDMHHSRSNEEYIFILSLLETAELSNEYAYHHDRFIEKVKNDIRITGLTGAAIDGIITGVTTTACPGSVIGCIAAVIAIDSLVSNLTQVVTGEITEPLILEGLQYVAGDDQAAAWLYVGLTVGLDAPAAISFAKQLAKSNINPYNLLPNRTPVKITQHADGSFRTADGKFASQGGIPAPGTRSAQEYTQFLRDKGFKVVGEELTVKGAVGNRRYDAVLRDNKGELWGIEYKSGSATKTPQQNFNDMFINRYGAEGVGKLKGETVVGNMTIYLP